MPPENKERNQAIAKDYREGMGCTALTRKYGVSRSTINRILDLLRKRGEIKTFWEETNGV